MSLPVAITIGISTLCLYKFLHGLWEVNFTPGFRPMFSPLSPFGALLPANALNPSTLWAWIRRKSAYFGKTHDVISCVPWFVGSPTFYTNSLDVMKQLLGAEAKLHLEKPQELTLASLWGHNVTSANGDVWRRHRRVVAPAFNSNTLSDVWKTVRLVYREMVEIEGWEQRDYVVFNEVNSFMLKFTFIIISRCGFGFDTSWSAREDQRMGFPEALRLVSETIIPRLIIPQWAYKLPIARLRKMNNAWLTVAASVSDAIAKRKAESNDPTINDSLPMDILNCLVTSWVKVDKQGLDERDVVSNMFSLMFAGHESTSSGIVTTLAYLALYPDEQQKAYKEICKAFLENDPSELIDANKLAFTLYCFWEGQRLCPSATFIPRRLTEDAIIDIKLPTRQSMHLKKGCLILFDLIGIDRRDGLELAAYDLIIRIGRNPRDFKDPEVYRPSRWEGISEHDVGTFGFGPRACIGRKFSQTEALAILSTLLSEWKVEINKTAGESTTHYEERVMGDAGLVGTSFALKRVPLKLVKRQV